MRLVLGALGLALSLGLSLPDPLLAENLPDLSPRHAEMIQTPTPDWVEDMPLIPGDPALRAAAQSGVHYILSDHQIRWQGAARHAWARTVMEVVAPAGLEQAATLTFDYDPSFEDLALTRLVILREGRAIDLMGQAESGSFRREGRLEEGMIDGTLTAWVQVPGLRVGDVVDYAALRITRPMLPGLGREVWSMLEWDVPLVLGRTIVHWPEASPPVTLPLPARVAVMQGPEGEGLRLEYQRLNHMPPPREPYAPLWADPSAVLLLGEAQDWGQVSAALTPIYRAPAPVPPIWQMRVAELMQAVPADPKARATAALRMVQDEIRTIPLPLGTGGILPRPPETVVESGFGDAKDKAFLLAATLRLMGIEADVALTDLDQGHRLDHALPGLSAFDHAILRIRLSGQDYWVDPSARHQGGDLEGGTPPNVGFALPLSGPSQTALVAIPILPEQIWHSDVTERFTFTPAGVFVTVESLYNGGAADMQRARWAGLPGREISADYLDYYTGRLPGIRMLAEITVSDNRKANRLRMQESYFLSYWAMARHRLSENFPFEAEDFASDFPDALPGSRSLPLQAGVPGRYRHRVEVRSAPIDFTPPPALRLENTAFSYAFTGAARPGGHMDLIWEYRATGAAVPPEQVSGLLQDAARVEATTWFSWNLQP